MFNTPLYETLRLTEKDDSISLFHPGGRIEGFCPTCGQRRVCVRSSEHSIFVAKEGMTVPDGFYRVEYICTMNPAHRIILFVLIRGRMLTKVGQHPSLADIANDEAKTYRKVFNETDQKELSRAIGLAAHGVGIGSFVYMRRVFERLIDRRYKGSGLTIPNFQPSA